MKRKPDPVDIHVGERLKTLREQRKLSQEKIAAAVNVTFQQIQKYERGANRISASRLYHLAHLLDVSVLDFFEGLDDLETAPVTPLFTRQQLRAAHGIQNIENDDLRKSIIILIETVASNS